MSHLRKQDGHQIFNILLMRRAGVEEATSWRSSWRTRSWRSTTRTPASSPPPGHSSPPSQRFIIFYFLFLFFIFTFLFFVCFVGSLGEGGQTCPLKVCNLIFLTCSLCMFSPIFFVDSFYPNALFFFMSYSNKTNDSQVYCYSNSCM